MCWSSERLTHQVRFKLETGAWATEGREIRIKLKADGNISVRNIRGDRINIFRRGESVVCTDIVPWL